MKEKKKINVNLWLFLGLYGLLLLMDSLGIIWVSSQTYILLAMMCGFFAGINIKNIK